MTLKRQKKSQSVPKKVTSFRNVSGYMTSMILFDSLGPGHRQRSLGTGYGSLRGERHHGFLVRRQSGDAQTVAHNGNLFTSLVAFSQWSLPTPIMLC